MSKLSKNVVIAVAALVCACGSEAGSSAPAAANPSTMAAAEALPNPNPEPSANPSTEAAMNASASTPVAPGEVQDLSAAIDAFGVDLYQRVRETEGNLVFSPASIVMALGMTAAGATGETQTEMDRVMHLEGFDPHPQSARLIARWNAEGRSGVDLRVVNRLFGEATYAFVPEFLALTRDRYGAELERVDFATDPEAQRAHINSWVSERTRSRIETLLPDGSINSDTRLALVNAVSFLGDWTHQFEASSTTTQAFHAAGGDVRTPMMAQRQRFRYASHAEVDVLEMPYGDGAFAMVVYLPKTRDGLPAVERSLSASQMQQWRSTLSAQQVEVTFPKFTIEGARVPLTELLPQMGMPRAFQAGLAEFTAMANPPSAADRLYIAKVFHEAFIQVDEEGTEAAAATAVVMGRGAGMPMPAPEFRADHPFLFEIRDLESQTTLFLGRLSRPTAG